MVTISEDQAISKGITLEQWLQEYLDMDYYVLSRYMHPAVGECIQLLKKLN